MFYCTAVLDCWHSKRYKDRRCRTANQRLTTTIQCRQVRQNDDVNHATALLSTQFAVGEQEQLPSATKYKSSLDTYSARKPWLHLWRTSYFLWPNYVSLQSLLLSHSYSPSIVTMSLFCTVSDIQRDIGQKSPLLTYTLPLFCAPIRGDPVLISPRFLSTEKYSPYAMALFVRPKVQPPT